MAQNASFGIGISPMNLQNSSGYYFSGNVRTQFNNTLGWQTEVGYATLNEDCMEGRIYFHMGDVSWFKAEREENKKL